jgi:hypothetical protein
MKLYVLNILCKACKENLHESCSRTSTDNIIKINCECNVCIGIGKAKSGTGPAQSPTPNRQIDDNSNQVTNRESEHNVLS